jgi:hypothetical protein
VHETTARINDLEGIEFNGTDSVQGIPNQYRARVFVVGNRVYDLSVDAFEGKSISPAEADRFFESFQLLDH